MDRTGLEWEEKSVLATFAVKRAGQEEGLRIIQRMTTIQSVSQHRTFIVPDHSLRCHAKVNLPDFLAGAFFFPRKTTTGFGIETWGGQIETLIDRSYL